ncbi:hypothetical protein QUF79_14695 [Fictibacillus enclensis]|uniref:hypothetical protein n=1 Tax=Fictibacillus enclensis TaxID=1017270 RepID=UPI0025A0B745|nr:hypothetical protein [Fictibacillus enclensis]MDM5199267.1 hypothetical protein [Fictibacillus enclensis]
MDENNKGIKENKKSADLNLKFLRNYIPFNNFKVDTTASILIFTALAYMAVAFYELSKRRNLGIPPELANGVDLKLSIDIIARIFFSSCVVYVGFIVFVTFFHLFKIKRPGNKIYAIASWVGFAIIQFVIHYWMFDLDWTLALLGSFFLVVLTFLFMILGYPRPIHDISVIVLFGFFLCVESVGVAAIDTLNREEYAILKTANQQYLLVGNYDKNKGIFVQYNGKNTIEKNFLVKEIKNEDLIVKNIGKIKWIKDSEN